jgi:dolichol-phosphate mannosyltransferase
MSESIKTVGIAMPIFNESDGISTTLQTLDQVLSAEGFSVELFIQDDCSTDQTQRVIEAIASQLKMTVHLNKNESNKGHGPTTFNAYQRAVKSKNVIILQLDSDGQFDPSEVPLVIDSVNDQHQVAMGIRTARTDPWFRKALTRLLRTYLKISFQCKSGDPNSPIRAYKREIIQDLLKKLPPEPLIPNIYLTILANNEQLKVNETAVSHKVREGSSITGTMWRSKRSIKFLIPKRLIVFSFKAILELRQFKNAQKMTKE